MTTARPTRTTLRALLALVLAATTLALLPAPAGANTGFRLEGRGYGHGIGMSQYGAQGQALAGRSHAQILATYYPGTTLTSRAAPSKVHVSIAEDQPSMRMVVRNGPTVLRYPDNSTIKSAAGDVWTITLNSAGGCVVKRTSGAAKQTTGDCPVFDPMEGSGGRVQPMFENGDGKYSYHHTYGRRARVHLLSGWASGKRVLDVVVRVPLEEYLYGLAEMPYSWEPAALRAQAIAGRSYAQQTMGGLRGDCSCHVYDDQRSQVYAGMDRELGSDRWYWANKWKPAVDKTATDVLTHNGNVVPAFYSSSSNGRTEARHEIWGGNPVSYLRSVDDPWSYRDDVNNPSRWWNVSIAPSKIARALGVDEVRSARVTKRSTSSAATEVVFEAVDDGKQVSLTRAGTWVRTALGLKSTTIDRIFLPPFVDDDGHTFERAIIWLASEGITDGCNPPSNSRFCPNEAVTRGQMAKFLVNALGLPPGDATFADTKGHTFERAIAALADAGVTWGCGDGTRFCPDDVVTRGEMAAFVKRGYDLPPGSATFRDTKGHRFERAIAALADADITSGCGDGTRFCPDDPVTRGEMAAFLLRAEP